MEKDIIWKSIPGFEGYYEASNDGKIRSVDHEVPFLAKGYIKTHYKVKGRVLSNRATGKYYSVQLCKDGVKQPFLVHRLIALTFIPNPDNKPCVDHRNGCTFDNSVENLRWATFCENSNNPITLKRMGDSKSKKVYVYDTNNNYIGEYVSILACTDALNLDKRNAWACLNGKQKSTKGYVLKKAPV